MFGRLIGNSRALDTSKMIGPYLLDGEEIIKVFKVWRDEVVITTLGIHHVDAKGTTGKKKQVSFVPNKFIEGYRFTSAKGMDWSANLEIYVRKHFGPLGKNLGMIEIKARKSDQEAVIELTKMIKVLVTKK